MGVRNSVGRSGPRQWPSSAGTTETTTAINKVAGLRPWRDPPLRLAQMPGNHHNHHHALEDRNWGELRCGVWRVACCVECGVLCGVWRVVCGVWCMVCGVW